MWRLCLFLCGTGASRIRCLIKAESRGANPAAGCRKGPGTRGAERLNKPRCPRHRLCYSPATLRDNQGNLMAHESDYKPGSMDIIAHKKAYAAFLTGTKWTFGFIMLIMIFLAIFRTH